MHHQILELRGLEGAETLKALASDMRLRILVLINKAPMNVNELAQALGISAPTVTKHLHVLDQAGLITSDYSPGVQGMQRRCKPNYNRFMLTFEEAEVPEYNVEQVSMPIGLYSLAHSSGRSGLASAERIISILDDPQAFLHPGRAAAQILWMSEGFIEYVFPCGINGQVDIHRLELVAEICSEAPNHDNNYPSDITVWINGVDIGTWTSPGDFGEQRGRLNPDWWNENWTQHGMLKVWSIDNYGSYIDGNPISDVNLKTAMIAPRQPITVRIGNKPDAEHIGGFNLFGAGFGNYEQDIVLRVHYIGKAGVRNESVFRGEER